MKRHLLIATLAAILTCNAFAQGTGKIATPISFNNPELTVPLGAGMYANPMPVDYDGDGVPDLVVVSEDYPYNGVWLYRNLGTAKKPLFAPAQRLGQRHDYGVVKHNARISYVHGKPRFLMAEQEMIDFLNVPFEWSKPIAYQGDRVGEGIDNPRSHTWAYVDYDGDGDQDIAVGFSHWRDYGWHAAFNEKGEWTNGPLHGWVYIIENEGGTYRSHPRLEAGGEPIDVFGAPVPCFADFDGDGDLDLICGEFLDGFTYFENIGSRTKPEYASGRRLMSKKGEVKMHLQVLVPVAYDWDGDGHTDLIVGEESGHVALIRNTGKKKDGMPLFAEPEYFCQKADLLKEGSLVTPWSVDWDGDGDEDLVCGNSAGEIVFIENLSGICQGDATPKWAAPVPFTVDGKPIRIMAGYNGSIQGPAEAKWGYTTLSVADWDGDGRLDIITNGIIGNIEWYRNPGKKNKLEMEAARLVQVAWEGETPKPVWNWWTPEPGSLCTQWRNTPVAIDWNKDGLMDLIVMDHEGYLSYFERFVDSNGNKVLRPGQRIFYCINGRVYRNGAVSNKESGMIDPEPGVILLNPSKKGNAGRRKFCFTDWDGDGMLDLIVDSTDAAWFKGHGTKDGLYIIEYMGLLGNTILEGHTTSPTAVDWNADGVPDILLGAEDGHFYLLRNDR